MIANKRRVQSAVLLLSLGLFTQGSWAAPATTTTKLTSSKNPSTFGQNVTLTATVSASKATGSVTFYDGLGLAIGTGSVASGTATLTTSTLSIGAHTLTATYSGDSSYGGSTSAALKETVGAPVTVITLKSSANPATAGQPVTFSVTLSPSTATGTVTFNDNGAALGTSTVYLGMASMTVSTLAMGAHPVTAVYGGDGSNPGANSTVLTQNVTQAKSTAALNSSANPSGTGQSITLTATVTPAAATGNVTFNDGKTVLGSNALSGGVATLVINTLSAGAHSLTAVYAGDANDAGSTSAAVQQTVNQGTTTTLSATPNPSNIGQGVTLTASITPASATGSITFMDGSTSLGTSAIGSGSATLTLTTFTAGTHNLMAMYGGDKNDAGSSSPVVTLTVTKAAATTTLSSSSNPSTTGQSVTLTAAVSPVSVTGTVTFKDGSATLGSGTLSGGSATLALTTLAVGIHYLTAVYSGDTNYNGSTSATLLQTVNQASTTTSMTSSPNPSSFGQSVTLSAGVSPSSATGSILFKDGTAVIGSAMLNGGVAALTSSTLSSGAHSLTAVYGGDANNATSTSPAVTQTVSQAASTTNLTTSSNPSNYGQSVTLTATLSPAAATGTVSFLDGSKALGSSLLRNGTATLSVTTLASGSHVLTAVYSGDNNDTGSTSSPVSQSVTQATTLTSLNASVNPSNFGQNVTLTASVSPSSATGSITFQDGTAALGSSNLINGSALLTLSTLSTGAHSLSAVYSGDSNNATSTSAAVTLTVRPSPTTTALTTSANPSTYGQSVTLTASISPTSASGTISFQDGAAVLGSANLSGGIATLDTTAFSSGSHSLTAVYSGDANNATSTSSVLNQTVRQIATTTSLLTSPNPSPYGQPVTLTATVSSGAGTVTFKDAAATLGTVTLSGNIASLTLTTLNIGGHALTAVYSGDLNDAASTSAGITQTVNAEATTTSLTSFPNPSTPGQTVTFTATASSGSGTVTLKDGAASLGSSPVNNGVAIFTIATVSVGTHSLTAVFSGDANNLGSTSAILIQTVNPATTSTTLVSSPNPSMPGQPVTLNATVSSGSGTVTFSDGAVALGTSKLTNGMATLTVKTLFVGVHALTAVYGGDANDAGSTSPVLSQTVTAAGTTTALTSTPNPSAPGQNVSLTATVSAGSGTVTFNDGTTALGSSPLSAGTAILVVNALATGVHSLTAAYSGDANNASSTSPAITQTVNGITSPSACQPGFSYTLGQPAPSAFPCQFTAIVATAFTVSSDSPWLQVTPSSGSLTPSPISLTISINPAGLSAGTYSGNFTITGAQLGSLTVPVQLVVSPAGTLLATPPSFSFNYPQGAPVPPVQSLTISSTNGTQLPFTVSNDSPSWLTAAVTSGVTPQPFAITINPTALDPNTYTGTLTLASPGLPSIQVTINLTVAAAPTPQLSVATAPVNLMGYQGGPPAVVQIPVSNPGSGYTATSTSSGWLTVSPTLLVTCDPTALTPGTYQGSVIATSADSAVTIPITFSVAAPGPLLQLSQTGLTFRAVAQGGIPLPQQLSMLNTGMGSLNWTATATTLSGGPWLLLPTPGDTSQTVTIDPTVVATLSPGDYYGQIQITSLAVNSPAVVTVLLTILPAGSDPGPEVYPASLIFTGPTAQTVTVGIRKGAGDQYVTGVTGSGFTFSPPAATIQPNQPATLQVAPDGSGPGQGTITLQFSDGTVRTINVVSLVPSSSSGTCGSLSLQWRSPAQTTLTVVQSNGYALELQVVDNCGNPMTSGTVQATFSNGDAAVNLVQVGNGIWSGTWQPVSTGPAIVTVTASTSAAIGQASPLGVTVLPGSAPIIAATSVQHAATMVMGTPIAPGTLIALPSAAASTQVFLGTETLPLLYAPSGQLNVQVPFDAPVNTDFQLTVQQGSMLSLPASLVITPAQPGVFTVDGSGTGQGLVYRGDGVTVAQPGSSAAAGETITIYGTGLGAVTASSSTTNPVAVTIGGQDGQASNGTLVPGQPGVYQVTAVVPSGVSGDTVPVVVTVTGVASPPVTMSVQ